MLCMTALKAGLPVAVRQLFFPFMAVAAGEIVTVISSNLQSFPSGGLSESSEKFYGLLN